MKSKTNNPHDRYFRAALSNPNVSREFFQQHLPPDILHRIDLDALHDCKESFISENLKASITDVLFETVFDERPGYIYLLIEHQSTPDKTMPIRVLRYMLDIMENHQQSQKIKPYPLVYPMIFYNGQFPYHYTTDIREMINADKGLVDKLLFQPIQLIDLSQIDDEALRQYAWSGIMNLVMKHRYDQDILPLLQQLVLSLRQIGKLDSKRFINQTWHYLLSVGNVERVELLLSTTKTLPHDTEGDLMTIATMLIDKGKREGRLEGKLEGEIKGKTLALKEVAIKLLARNVDERLIQETTELPLDVIEQLKEESIEG